MLKFLLLFHPLYELFVSEGFACMLLDLAFSKTCITILKPLISEKPVGAIRLYKRCRRMM